MAKLDQLNEMDIRFNQYSDYPAIEALLDKTCKFKRRIYFLRKIIRFEDIQDRKKFYQKRFELDGTWPYVDNLIQGDHNYRYKLVTTHSIKERAEIIGVLYKMLTFCKTNINFRHWTVNCEEDTHTYVFFFYYEKDKNFFKIIFNQN